VGSGYPLPREESYERPVPAGPLPHPPEDLHLPRKEVHVYDSAGQVIGFSRQKAFKLKEDIRVYGDETEKEERLLIKARQIIDFSAAYDVVDAKSGSKVGALRRKGFTSILRDSWEFLDASDRSIGIIQEDSMFLALVRRFLTNLIPQSYHAMAGESDVAKYHQNFNPFVYKLRVELETGAREKIDPRLILAAGILLAAIEGRQN
jgi:hypothetical protein